MNHSITVIIPTFKRPHLLKKAIESVLSQTYPHFHVLVLDNCSGDETETITKEFQENDARVKYHCHSQNIGMISNYKYGYDQITTSYFCFLSDDDYYFPWFLETAISDLQQYPNAAFSACAVQIIKPPNEILFNTSFFLWNKTGYFEATQGFLELTTPFFKPFTPTCTLFNQRILSGVSPNWDEKSQLFWDPDFLLQITSRFPYVINEKICGVFTAHDQGYSSGFYVKLHNSHEHLKIYLKASRSLVLRLYNLPIPKLIRNNAIKTVSQSLKGNMHAHIRNYFMNAQLHDACYTFYLLIKYLGFDKQTLKVFLKSFNDYSITRIKKTLTTFLKKTTTHRNNFIL